MHASQTVANYWLPRYLVRYRALNPQVDIALTPGNTRTVAGAILDGSCDLGIVEGEIENDKLIKQIVAQDRLVIVVSEHHPWADGRPVDVADLDATTWIMREQGSGTRAAFKSDIRALGQDPSELQVILEMPSNEACLAAVQVGQSATALSRRAVLPRLAEGAFHQVNFSLPVRHFTMIRHADHHVARSVRAMMDLLSEPSEVDEIV
ncbi:LysR substrate-binding domain-containing protein [Hoeflea sp. G2-23]|uniref:LysR substrate-binding domain-containing protein n=1 Tax=Hoeflea algicola TaxID=2983763 RepID=A0ABT3ZEB0_9HYPH|nr:LysR substrate-binding domain-containing protein [Hoeflea algicola]MCY0150132.1 LysR substrate-binding domain-containing protein [Hoeflea algicola]